MLQSMKELSLELRYYNIISLYLHCICYLKLHIRNHPGIVEEKHSSTLSVLTLR